MPSSGSLSRESRAVPMLDAEQSGRHSGVNIRTLIIGLIGAALVAACIPYNDYHLCNTPIAGNHLPVGIVFILLVLVALNGVWKRLWEGSHLSSSELVVIWAMLTAAASVPGSGLMRYWFHALIMPLGFAQREPGFKELLPHIDSRLLPALDDSSPIVDQFIHGGGRVPWVAWAGPLLRWGVLFVALYAIMLCMSAVLQRQWVRNECLAFPLAQFTLELVGEPARGRAFNDFFRNPVTWVGAGLSIIIFTLYGLNCYFPMVPSLKLSWNLRPAFSVAPWNQGSGSLYSGRLYLGVVAATMLVPTDVAFSLWAFYLVYQFRKILAAWIGMPVDWTVREVETQGSYFLLAFVLIWVARGHLRQVVRDAWRMLRGRDVPAENRPAATAMIVLAAAVLVAWIWLSYWSVGAVWGAVFLLAFMVINIVLARAVCEGGLIHVEAWWPYYLGVWVVGIRIVGVEALLMLGMISIIAVNDLRAGPLPYMLNSGRMAEACKRLRMGRFFLCMALSLVVAFVVGTYSHLSLNYRLGFHRVDDWAWQGSPRRIFGGTWSEVNNPSHSAKLDAHFLLGSGVTAFLSFMRMRFHWWPFHPLGYAMAYAWPIGVLWVSILLGWALKLLILRYGGARTYYKVRPAVCGAIMGECLMAAVWGLVTLAVSLQGSEPIRILLEID